MLDNCKVVQKEVKTEASKKTSCEIDLIIAAAFWDFYRVINAKVERYAGITEAFNWSDNREHTFVFVEELMEIAKQEDHNLQYVEIQAVVNALKQEAPLYTAEVDFADDGEALVGRHHLMGFLRLPHHFSSNFSLDTSLIQSSPITNSKKEEGSQENPNKHNNLAEVYKTLLKTNTYRNK